MVIKAPNFLQTFTLFKRLGDLLTFGKIAQCCGKEMQTAEAWGRRPASNEYPTGTGRNNPVDCILRLMGLAHKEGDRVLAREIAETFTGYADYLDGIESEEKASLNDLVGASVKEHGEAICAALEARNYTKAMTELVQAEIALRDLKGFIQKQLTPTREIAKDAVQKHLSASRIN